MTAAERVEAVNSARHTLIQAVTGLVVIGGVVFTALGLWYTAQTLSTTQEGQITDRYTKAVEQLGSTKSDVRLGGIYALQRLAADSPRDRDTIRNVLSAFVRNHDMCTLQPGEKTPPKRCSDDKGEGNYPIVRPPADVVAALTIAPTLSALKYSVDIIPGVINSGDITGRADFSNSRFPGAALSRANLASADLTSANLTRAQLVEVDLKGARLAGANLAGADLFEVDLRGADLIGVNLMGASLSSLEFGGAYLMDADLSRAELVGAELSGVSLSGANLSRADLSIAELSGTILSGANLSRASLVGAELSGADLTSANLSRADLSGADLSGAKLSADLSGAELSGADLSGADLRGMRGMTEQQVRAVATVDSDTTFVY
ncbi:pentapeptide repeat-containing protein [Nonomuraea sp. C10]|nr:pentapeptide repeat-containing protein [Nonomuraea sp. C10]